MHHLVFSFMLLGLITQEAQAQETLETIEVSEEKPGPFSSYWEENKGTQIFSGKKNTITDLKQIPKLQTNNYRQATSQTPGLLISEVPNESLAAITYRGLGDPHESYNVLLLQDGIPVAADMFGYPAHYFSPALPMMDKFQFIRGGAGLHYGPQPGGVVNYISSPLRKGQSLSGKVGITGGTYNLLTTNNVLTGSKGEHAYAVEYYRRQGEGPQRINSNFEADYVQIREHIFKGKNTFKLVFNGYNSDHGNPGGFAKDAGGNNNTFGDDQGSASKRHDRLKVSRAQLSLAVEHRLDETSRVEATLWGNAYRRYSKSQKDGGFGTFATGSKNDIVTQDYYGYNGQVRYLNDYSAFGQVHTFAAGIQNYNLISPIVTEEGQRADANHGIVKSRLDRRTHANSVFMENRFTFNKLMVTPGVRVENIRQSIDERKKSVTGPKRLADETVNAPLFGLGLAYHLTDESQLYANASEAYKPVTYNETVPAINNATVSEDIDPSKIYNYEVGHRGQTEKLNWDISAFFIRYENKFGLVGNNYQNVGASEHKGIDVASELKFGNFSFYANMEFLDARFTWGPQKDKAPQYAPKTMTRAGLIYNKEERLKVALMGVVVGRHNANDNNGNGTTGGTKDDYEIPSYTVFDLTADYHFARNWMAHGGISNLLDKEYYSRVRTDGVAWALGRNFYAGVTYKF
jgi:Fe(3+) dicitrate transport protein